MDCMPAVMLLPFPEVSVKRESAQRRGEMWLPYLCGRCTWLRHAPGHICPRVRHTPVIDGVRESRGKEQRTS